MPAREAQLEGPNSVLLDDSGGLLIADERRVRRLDLATGLIVTVAGTGADQNTSSGDGGPARDAALYQRAMVLDGSGSLFVVDFFTSTIRRIDSVTETIQAVAGGGTAYKGDGGPATSALIFPRGIAIDRSGNIYIADESHGILRVVEGIAVPVAR